MPLDQARWQIDILAADKTAAAFASVDRRMKTLETTTRTSLATMASQSAAGAQAFALIGRAAGPLVGILAGLSLAHRTWTAGMKSGELIDQAAQLGTTTDALQAWRLVAMQSGVAAEQFDGALQRLTGQVGQANSGSDEAIARFDRLGVKLLDARGQLRPINDLLPEVARGLQGVSSETERNAIAQELFGRSGARIVTMLGTLAQGTDAVTAAARAQNAIVEKDSLEAWNKLDAQLKVTSVSADAALASLGAPIATAALEIVNKILTDINANLAKLKLEGQTAGGRAAGVDTKHLEEQLAVQRNLLGINPNNKMAQQSVAALERRLGEARAQQQAAEGADAAGIYVGDTVRFTGTSGRGQPTGNKAKSAGESEATARARETQKAMDDLFDSIEKVRKASEGVADRFGNGMAYAARETAELNEMLTMGFIDGGTHSRAIEDVARKADDMARAFRGAAGGVDGFQAGMEQALADMSAANTNFEMGRQLVDTLSDSITDLATGAETDFNRILQSFLGMLIQMEMRAAASNIWNALSNNGGPTDQGMGGMIGTLLSSVAAGFGGGGNFDIGPVGGAYNGGGSLSFGGPRAGGGPVSGGMAYLVGEEGPELFVPGSGGTIVPNGGGGTTVVLQMTNQFGSIMSRAETEQQLRMVEERARKGAIAGVLEAKSRGGSYRNGMKR